MYPRVPSFDALKNMSLNCLLSNQRFSMTNVFRESKSHLIYINLHQLASFKVLFLLRYYKTSLCTRINTLTKNCTCFNKCCWYRETVCNKNFTLCLLHMAKCMWWFPCCQNFGVETYDCALAEKNRYETGDFDKNRYNFYMKFILLIDTWHIIFNF